MSTNLSVKKQNKTKKTLDTLEYVLFLCQSEAVGAAELSKAQHRLEKQRCEELESRVHNMEEELKKLQTDKERLEEVGRLCAVLTI